MLLTTQYLDEADRLAQQIALVDQGRIVAQGTAPQLKARIGGSVLNVHLADPAQLPLAAAALASLTAADAPRLDAADGGIRLAVADPQRLPKRCAAWAPGTSRSRRSSCSSPASTTSF